MAKSKLAAAKARLAEEQRTRREAQKEGEKEK